MPDAGRVIAGAARGRRLIAPGRGTRPLGDRVKQTLFAILEPRLPGAAFLDLFAGSGAAGIEALSRGAARATFVEHDAAACSVIRENLRRTGLGGASAEIVPADAVAWLAGRSAAAPRFDVVVIDPPYDMPDLLFGCLERLGDPARVLLAADAAVAAKHFWRDRPPPRVGLLASRDERRFGETALTIYRLVGSSEVGG